MDLRKYHNQRVRLTDIDGQIFEGTCIFEAKDIYDENQDGLSVKNEYKWFKIYESEIKSIELI